MGNGDVGKSPTPKLDPTSEDWTIRVKRIRADLTYIYQIESLVKSLTRVRKVHVERHPTQRKCPDISAPNYFRWCAPHSTRGPSPKHIHHHLIQSTGLTDLSHANAPNQQPSCEIKAEDKGEKRDLAENDAQHAVLSLTWITWSGDPCDPIKVSRSAWRDQHASNMWSTIVNNRKQPSLAPRSLVS